MKHLRKSIWELRPSNERILFFVAKKGQIVLLTSFLKKSQKTPESELIKAEKLMDDWLSRQ